MISPTSRAAAEQAIAADLVHCDIALAVTTGRARAPFLNHRRACFDQIREWNVADGLSGLSDTALLAALLEV